MPGPDSLPPQARIFVALWPDATTMAALRVARGHVRWSVAGLPTAAAMMHLTVQYIGGVDRNMLPKIVEALAMPVGEVKLVLDRLRRFNGGAIALVGEPAASLSKLRNHVVDRLGDFGVRREDRTFKPHVTLG